MIHSFKSLFILAAITAISTLAIAAEKRTTATIKEVTVYLNGAQINTISEVSIPAGSSEIIIENLPENISDDQLQAKGEGDFIIQSVVRKINYLNENQLPKEVKALKDSLEALNYELAKQQALERIYTQEEEVLMANKSIGGNNNGVDALGLEEMVNFLRKRLTELYSKKADSQKARLQIQEKMARINNQLNELNNKNKYRFSEVIISVISTTAQKAKINLSYFVNDAGWTPYYNIRAVDASSPLQLEYKANVWQHTGYDWSKVKLTLSTGNPFINATKPEMQPWWVTYEAPVYPMKTKGVMMSRTSEGNAAYEAEDVQNDALLVPMPAPTTAAYTKVTEASTNVLFEISLPYTIPSDGKQYAVSVQESSIEASYKYYAAPKLDKDAFLLAYITSWEKYNLLAAEANIYFEGMYVGKTYINTASTGDTLQLSLGRDKNVSVERNTLKDYTEKKIMASDKKETHGYEIVVKNKKKKDIEILLQDQIPLSTNKEIIVELLEKSRAEYKVESGFLTWNLKIKSGADEKVKFSYSIQYPKDKIITK
jgi:uncharacterized protein (TIGR02231 family)